MAVAQLVCKRQMAGSSAQKKIRGDRSCQRCGRSPITGYKFCGPECRDRARSGRSWSERYPMPSASVWRVCSNCGGEFRRKVRGSGSDAGICCSRECGFELIRKRGELSRAITAEKEVYRRWAKPRPNGYGYLGRIKQLRAKLAAKASFGSRPCSVCGGPVGYSSMGAPRSYCSDSCIKQSDGYRRSKAAWRKARKARQRGATVERVDAIRVFERDGWRCHLCGRRTPKGARGTYRPNAPELDHIVPLSKGGTHSYVNTACACRECNLRKSDRVIGQPSLLALVG